MGKIDDGLPHAPSWQEVLLVCKACGKRGSGPKKLKAKEVVSEARRLLRTSRPRPRIIPTGCLGLCPKAAIAVAMVGAGQGGARIVPVPSLKRFAELLPLLAAPATATHAAAVRTEAAGAVAASAGHSPPLQSTVAASRPLPGIGD